MKKNKLGLYARYDCNGIFTGKTAIKNSNDIYKSNNDAGSRYQWVLITDREDEIYSDPKSLNISSELPCHCCEQCGNDCYYLVDGGDIEICEECDVDNQTSHKKN